MERLASYRIYLIDKKQWEEHQERWADPSQVPMSIKGDDPIWGRMH